MTTPKFDMPDFQALAVKIETLPEEHKNKLKAVMVDYEILLGKLKVAAETKNEDAIRALRAEIDAFKAKYPMDGN